MRRSHSTGVSRRTELEEPSVNVLVAVGVSVVPEPGLDGPGAVGPVCDNAVSAWCSAAGSSLPRFAARRRMPVAARADRKNLGGVVGCSTSASVECNDEHTPSTLRHSEVASVENPVGPHVPEFIQATDERPKVAPGIAGEEARYVFEDDRGRSVSLHKVEEGVGEPAAGVEPVLVGSHASPLAGDGEVLARKTAGPEDIPMPLPTRSALVSPSGGTP